MLMTALPNIALGVRYMLLGAIYRQVDQTGEPPKRFELHPAVVQSLALELKPCESHEFGGPRGTNPRFNGVEIVPDRLATQPKMITAANQVEYL